MKFKLTADSHPFVEMMLGTFPTKRSVEIAIASIRHGKSGTQQPATIIRGRAPITPSAVIAEQTVNTIASK